MAPAGSKKSHPHRLHPPPDPSNGLNHFVTSSQARHGSSRGGFGVGRGHLKVKYCSSRRTVFTMAWRYIKMGICGMSAANRRQEEELEATAVAVSMVLGKKRCWGGSVVGHEVKNREREEVNAQIMRDYFNDPPLYGEEHFRRRMRKSLFLCIVEDVTARNKYFKQKRNAAKKKGFTPIHKCLVALRMLAYGGVADALDDTYKMAETTVLKTLMQFVHTVIDVYEKEYLRPPRAHELEVILKQNEARGFLGMVDSIDCMHWEWENCPTALAGMYKGHKSKPTVILEAVATQDLRIWHAFFGLSGPEAPAILENRDIPQISELIDAYNCIKSKETNSQLQHDLVEHLWSHFGASTGPFA
ncbi:hypothetical protein U9M48_030989 [Paspalum notatum var. saurae]|uniref:Uncharacterized protein n=1 Tax=Paspalum notatum var. saurae TaxID=547442 RepID=A0AAQ3U1R4_PASNO